MGLNSIRINIPGTKNTFGVVFVGIKIFVPATSYSRHLRLPSPQQSLTAVFEMRTGVTSAMNHQNKKFNSKPDFIKTVVVEQSPLHGKSSCNRDGKLYKLINIASHV